MGALGVIFLFLGSFAYGAILAAPWLPVRRGDVGRMLNTAGIKPGMVVYDLGSGDGRIVVEAAKRFGAKAVGYEVALLPFFWSRVKIMMNGVSGLAQIRYKNFFHASLTDADVVCAFLSPWAMRKLEPKFERELKAGARVISYVFALPTWKPDFTDKDNPQSLAIFFYTKK